MPRTRRHNLRPLRWRDVRPNASDKLALVDQDRPCEAMWPIRLTQLVGGRTWSLSLVHDLTPTPVPTPKAVDAAVAAAHLRAVLPLLDGEPEPITGHLRAALDALTPHLPDAMAAPTPKETP